jgi:hypothetical protein
MINEAKIINQPYSGQYEERIYDIPSSWNSQKWAWIKFSNEDFSEWCGEFRGSPRYVAISKKHNSILVLTSDYLYQLDHISGELIEYETQPQYQNLTLTPSGDFIVSDYYSIELVKSIIKEKQLIASPIHMDMIKFHSWSNNKLLITCEEFYNWDRHIELELNCETLQITMKNDI